MIHKGLLICRNWFWPITTSSQRARIRLFGPVVRRVTRTSYNDKITRSIRVRGIFWRSFRISTRYTGFQVKLTAGYRTDMTEMRTITSTRSYLGKSPVNACGACCVNISLQMLGGSSFPAVQYARTLVWTFARTLRREGRRRQHHIRERQRPVAAQSNSSATCPRDW